MKAAEPFDQSTAAANQLWQTDFTYLRVTGWGWYYLSTVIDDCSRYIIISWQLCHSMNARDVSATLKDALGAAKLSTKQRPKLVSDNGPCYVSSELRDWLAHNGLEHPRAQPSYPMTQGKIERWHRSLKNRILLENYYLPEHLELQIKAFVAYYTTRRYHESLNNLTPEDLWLAKRNAILEHSRKIKKKTMKLRKQLHQ